MSVSKYRKSNIIWVGKNACQLMDARICETSEQTGIAKELIKNLQINCIKNMTTTTLHKFAKAYGVNIAQMLLKESKYRCRYEDASIYYFPSNIEALILEDYYDNMRMLSAYLGVCSGSLSNYCKGINSPTLKNAQKIADYFGVEIADLFKKSCFYK